MIFSSVAHTNLLSPISEKSLTAWQQAVYRIVQQIPSGRVASYGEVARRAGQPGGSRAVGRVLAGNPFSFCQSEVRLDGELVPCHRVVRSDGSLGGFAGEACDLATKVRLLQEEGVVCHDGRVMDFSTVSFSFAHV